MEKLVIVDGESYKDWITEISNEFKKEPNSCSGKNK